MRLLLPALLVILLTPLATAAAGEPKVVKAGGTLRLGHFIVLTADCVSIGKATLSMIKSPSLGSIQAQEEIDTPKFKETNRFHVCNDRPVPVTAVYYHARPDAKGTDEFIFELIYDFQKPRRHHAVVSVQ